LGALGGLRQEFEQLQSFAEVGEEERHRERVLRLHLPFPARERTIPSNADDETRAVN
jgi:hypothetical protein